MSTRPTAPTVGAPPPIEKHYTPAECAANWGFSAGTWRRLVADEPDVLRLQGLGPTADKRPYTTYSIPASVADRVRQRLAHRPLQPAKSTRRPRRVVLLRNENGRVA
jgi:hypothetical protein